MRKVPGPVVLLILDGVGSTEPFAGNAVTLAKTPFLESAWDVYPHGLLHSSAEYVGLPKNVAGNSEVGHTNIGAGQVVYQYLPRINQAIEKGLYATNNSIMELISAVRARGKALHLVMLLSDGNVHSSIDHLKATLEMCKMAGYRGDVFIHAYTDGRDTRPKEAERFFEMLDKWISEIGCGELATIVGRQFGMDRNKTWNRTKVAYDLLTNHKGTVVPHWKEALKLSYEKEITDEFFEPFVIASPTVKNAGFLKDGDGLFFMNFRPDRMIQLVSSLLLTDFTNFDREVRPLNLQVVTMVRYGVDLPVTIAFPPNDVRMPLGRVVSMAGMRQLRLAESEKFPHVTYFLNGGTNSMYPGEMRINIPSPDVSTYDKKPEMSIYELTRSFVKNLEYNVYDFFVINFANGDMVGHTGVLNAGISAMEHVDNCTAQVVKQVIARNGCVFVTADHGNVEEMLYAGTNDINTDHSVFPVPFMAIYKDSKSYELPLGKLADIAPTMLHFLGINPPSDMTGSVLVD